MFNKNYLTSKVITLGFTIYWLVFWLFNGLDKFLNRIDLGAITWFGKDRGWQFGVYLENMGVPLDNVPAILNFAGFWELGVAILFMMGLFLLVVVGEQEEKKSDKFFKLGLFVSMLTFIAFCAFDVVVGDRAELLEHSTYMVVVAVSYICLVIENMVSDYKENKEYALEGAQFRSLTAKEEADMLSPAE